MYAKCGSLEDAESMFARMQGSDVVLWNSMIGAYALYGMVEKAIELFDRMQRQGVRPNKVTFINMLVACSAHPMALHEGMQIHHCILEGEFDQITAVGNALISAYSKCACIDDVRCVFDKMPERNVFSWSTLISAYANHGFGRQALHLFAQMQESGVPPDKVTFIGLLAACSRAGLLDEAYKYFVSMGPAYGISPISDHYFCMVDALCRTGRLNHAEVVMKCMPFQPAHASFSTFLSACRHNPACMKQGEEAAFSWHELDRTNLVPYLMLGYIYTASGWVADASALVKGLRDQIVAERERNIKGEDVASDKSCF
jgi:pentatricopeptide repeat protein